MEQLTELETLTLISYVKEHIELINKIIPILKKNNLPAIREHEELEELKKLHDKLDVIWREM